GIDAGRTSPPVARHRSAVPRGSCRRDPRRGGLATRSRTSGTAPGQTIPPLAAVATAVSGGDGHRTVHERVNGADVPVGPGRGERVGELLVLVERTRTDAARREVDGV